MTKITWLQVTVEPFEYGGTTDKRLKIEIETDRFPRATNEQIIREDYFTSVFDKIWEITGRTVKEYLTKE